MPKYNPKNKQHRKTLATRITKMLVVAGFKLDKTAKSAEDVYANRRNRCYPRVRSI